MEGQPVDTALDRIEAALARLQRAVEGTLSDSREVSRRHEALKTSVSEALTEIDAVIAQASE